MVAKVEGGHIRYVRVAMGGVGTKPWRSHEAEAALMGKSADAAHFRTAAEAALAGAKPRTDNAFKVELAKRCLVRSLKTRNGLDRTWVPHVSSDVRSHFDCRSNRRSYSWRRPIFPKAQTSSAPLCRASTGR